MGGPDATPNLWKQLFSAVRASGGYPGNVWSLLKTKWWVGQRSMQNTWLQVAYSCTDGFNLEILPRGFVMQRQILINVIIFIAYMLNLPLNTQRPYHRSQRAGKLGLDFGSWQSPDISRSHLYRGTIAWTLPTVLYREYTVLCHLYFNDQRLQSSCTFSPSMKRCFYIEDLQQRVYLATRIKIYRQVSKLSSFRCSWSIACPCCSNYIFILDLTPGFNGLVKGNCKMRRESFKCWYLVRLILEILG